MCDPEFMEDAVATHNYWRRRHGVPRLRLNPYLCKLAQGWAVHLATTARPMTSENTLYQRPLGENIAMKWANNGTDVTGREITDQWYSGIARYDFQARNGEDTGQFTQMIWRDCEDFGIGKARVEDGSWVVVANYYPAGNIVGQYEYNVRGTIDGRIILPSQRDPHAQPRTHTIYIQKGAPSRHRRRSSTTSTIYPYNPDHWDTYSQPSPPPALTPPPVFVAKSLPRRKSSSSSYRPPSPADNPVTKMVKTQKILDYHNGFPYTKTVTTETKIHPDGSKSVVTTESMDPM